MINMQNVQNITMIPEKELLTKHKHPLLMNQKLEKEAVGEVVVFFFKEDYKDATSDDKKDPDNHLNTRFLAVQFRNSTAIANFNESGIPGSISTRSAG